MEQLVDGTRRRVALLEAKQLPLELELRCEMDPCRRGSSGARLPQALMQQIARPGAFSISLQPASHRDR